MDSRDVTRDSPTLPSTTFPLARARRAEDCPSRALVFGSLECATG
jgi:hypothetical protein